MANPSLRHAVETLAQTVIQSWDGSNFSDTQIKGNFNAQNKDTYSALTRLSVVHGDPISEFPTNIIRNESNGYIYQVVSSSQQTHRGEVYQTLYNLIRTHRQYSIISLSDNTASESGLSYGYEQADKVETVVATTYCKLVNNAAKSISNPVNHTKASDYNCRIDSKLAKPSRGLILRDALDGNDYQFQAVDTDTVESYVCSLTLIGE
jgi:hypothetical protein